MSSPRKRVRDSSPRDVALSLTQLRDTSPSAIASASAAPTPPGTTRRVRTRVVADEEFDAPNPIIASGSLEGGAVALPMATLLAPSATLEAPPVELDALEASSGGGHGEGDGAVIIQTLDAPNEGEYDDVLAAAGELDGAPVTGDEEDALGETAGSGGADDDDDVDDNDDDSESGFVRRRPRKGQRRGVPSSSAVRAEAAGAMATRTPEQPHVTAQTPAPAPAAGAAAGSAADAALRRDERLMSLCGAGRAPGKGADWVLAGDASAPLPDDLAEAMDDVLIVRATSAGGTPT